MVDPQVDLRSALSGKPGRIYLCGGSGECDSETLIETETAIDEAWSS